MAAAAAGQASAPVAGAANSAIAEVQSAVVEAEADMDPVLAEPLPIGQAETKATPEKLPVSSISPEDQDVHRKALRFARLLIAEIKLYNHAKVAACRQPKDLYDRLKEEIETSHAASQKRY